MHWVLCNVGVVLKLSMTKHTVDTQPQNLSSQELT